MKIDNTKPRWLIFWVLFFIGCAEKQTTQYTASYSHQSLDAVEQKDSGSFENNKMSSTRGETSSSRDSTTVIVPNPIREDPIAVAEVVDDRLHGQCVWFNSDGEMISIGVFKKGMPWDGTFINWSKSFLNIDPAMSWKPDVHLRDWMTLYDATFDSLKPDYSILLEEYALGKQI